MADASPALRALDDELSLLKQRLHPNDPRRGRITTTQLAASDKLGSSGSDAQIARISAATTRVRALPGNGVFKSVIEEAEAAIDAL